MADSVIENILNQLNCLSPDERRRLTQVLDSGPSAPRVARRSVYGTYAGRLTPLDEFLPRKARGYRMRGSGTRRVNFVPDASAIIAFVFCRQVINSERQGSRRAELICDVGFETRVLIGVNRR
jgi:hypothetical protein